MSTEELPPPLTVNATLQDLLMIEMTSLVHRLTADLLAAREAPPGDTIRPPTEEDGMERAELIESKLESIGFRVGHGLVDRQPQLQQAVQATTRRMDDLERIKFICKDLWALLFGKQIDNLKTNHRGVYVLTDHAFKWFARMGLSAALLESRGGRPGTEHLPYLWFPCGMLRGALAFLGTECVVIAECPNGPPGVTFQIKTIARQD